MTEELDLAKHSCWNKECPDYGKRDQGNIIKRIQGGKTTGDATMSDVWTVF